MYINHSVGGILICWLNPLQRVWHCTAAAVEISVMNIWKVYIIPLFPLLPDPHLPEVLIPIGRRSNHFLFYGSNPIFTTAVSNRSQIFLLKTGRLNSDREWFCFSLTEACQSQMWWVVGLTGLLCYRLGRQTNFGVDLFNLSAFSSTFFSINHFDKLVNRNFGDHIEQGSRTYKDIDSYNTDVSVSRYDSNLLSPFGGV